VNEDGLPDEYAHSRGANVNGIATDLLDYLEIGAFDQVSPRAEGVMRRSPVIDTGRGGIVREL
jgi:hypothetical protein